LPIIPLGPNKRPLLEAWKPYQTRLPTIQEIEVWKKKRPAAWGMVTGALSGRITLDFDGEAGADTMRKLGVEPHRRTPSGGYHADFVHPGWRVPTLNSKTNRELGARWPGLDRADGGYAAIAGRSGRGTYEWLRDPKPHSLAVLPKEVADFLGLLSSPARSNGNSRIDTERLIHMALNRAMSGGRNNAGFWLAGQLRDNGYNRTEAVVAMRNYRCRCPETNTKGDYEPYTEAEVFASLKEAYSRPAREPWKGRSNSNGHASVSSSDNWKELLIKSDNGIPKAILGNAITALRWAPDFFGVLAFNEFTSKVVALKPLPWRNAVPHADEWTDDEDRRTADWLQHQGIHVRVEVAAQAVQTVAYEQRVHPVREYLDSLKWDGIKRIHCWLSRYLGVEVRRSESEEDSGGRSFYVAEVGARWLISAVARIYKPGEKVDCCLILEGPQGIGKSRSLRILGGRWFTDEIADLGSKDAALQTRGVWIIEIAELESMSRSAVGRVKDFMSRSVDRFRPPYGRHIIESPRQCVFGGSVNHSSYLKDETGGRRFWPVSCGQIRLSELERDRDQLWAEAVHEYKHGAVWWLNSLELNRLAEQEQDDRYEEDPWHSRIAAFVSKRDDVSVPEVLEQCIHKPTDQQTQGDANRVAKCLMNLGWKQRRPGPRGARKRRYYAPQMALGI
jgi:predicted P-loop ATPase